MALNPATISQQLAAANDDLEYFQMELGHAESQLGDAKQELEKVQKALDASEEAMKSAGHDAEIARKKLRIQTLKCSKEKVTAVIKAKVAAKRTMRIYCTAESRHKDVIRDLEVERNAAQAEAEAAATAASDLETARSTIQALQARLLATEKQASEASKAQQPVKYLTTERDAAQRESALNAKLASDLRKEINDMNDKLLVRDSAATEINARCDSALSQLADANFLLQRETSAKECAQGQLERLQDTVTTTEALLDRSIDQLGESEFFARRPKLDYILVSAKAIQTLQMESGQLHRQLAEEREKSAHAPGAWTGTLSSVVEDQLQAQIDAQRTEIEGHLAQVAGLESDLQKKEATIAGLNKQLVGKQLQATELRALASKNEALPSRLDGLRNTEKLLASQVGLLTKSCDHERSEKDETEKRLYEAVEDAKRLSREHAAAMEAKEDETRQLREQLRRDDAREAKIMRLLTREQKPWSDPEPTRKELAGMEIRARMAAESSLMIEMRAQVQRRLEEEFTEELREQLKLEVEKEFLEEKRDDLERELREEYFAPKALDDSPTTVVEELRVSPVYISISEEPIVASAVAGCASAVPTESSTTKTTIIVHTFLALFLSAAALIWAIEWGVRPARDDRSVVRFSTSSTVRELLPATHVFAVAAPAAGNRPSL